MSLNINKRLRYFNTEAEYLAYVEAQRAAAEAGTLELMETTVCCIKHNDDTTPDEYHPSTEAGYTDVVFNYNENDDIRYVPFINPMWTSRLCTVYPIKDSEGTIIGYKPVLYQNINLPDVIDGQQFTLLDEEFILKALNFPQFSISNIEEISYTYEHNSYKSYSTVAPSYWKSLKKVSAVSKDSMAAYQHSYVRMFLFGENNILNAPNLEVFTTPYFTPVNFNNIQPTLISPKLKYVNFTYAPVDGVLNLSTFIPNTESLEVIAGLNREATFSYSSSIENFSFEYNGDGLLINNLYLKTINDEGVTATFTGSGENIWYRILKIEDSNLSSTNLTKLLPLPQNYSSEFYTNAWNSSRTTLTNCTINNLDTGSLLGFISWENNTISLNISPETSTQYVEILNSSNDINATLNSGCYLTASPKVSGGTCNITMVPNSQDNTIRIRKDSSNNNTFNEIVVHIPSNEQYSETSWYLWRLDDINIPASKISFTGGKIHSTYSYDLGYDYPTVVPFDLYLFTANNVNPLYDGIGISKGALRYSIVHCRYPRINIDFTISKINCIIESTADTDKNPQYTPSGNVSSSIFVTLGENASVGEYDIVFDNSIGSIFRAYLYCTNSNTSLLEVQKVLSAFNTQIFSTGLSIENSIINIHRNFYSQLDTQSMSIVNQFATINIYEDEVS